jgi:hypothetical protein
MKRYLKFSVVFVTVWALASFAGVMFDTARAGFWTKSLMASLLLGALLAPLMTFFRPSGDSARRGRPADRNAQRFEDSQQRPDFSGGSTPEGSFEEQWPYVDSDEGDKKEAAGEHA